MVLLKRMGFKGKLKIQNHCKKCIYHVEGQPYVGLPVFRITPVAGEGKVKLWIKTCYCHLKAALGRILKMREVDKVSRDIKIASWQVLMMMFQRLKLY